MPSDDEDDLLRSVAIQNAKSILLARQRTEQELVRAKEALERKTVELAQSLAMLRATLESTTDGILVTDTDGNVTGFNARYEDLWELPRFALEGGAHRELLEINSRQFADPVAFKEQISAIHDHAGAETFDVFALADGRVFELVTKPQVVDGRAMGRVWNFRDITQHRRVEEALREETRILELLNRTGSTLTSKLDLQTLVQTVTDAATELSGAKFGAFFYTNRDERGDVFMLYTLSGAPKEAFEKFGHPRTTALFGPTFRGDAPIRSADILKDPRYGKMAPHHGMPPGHLRVRSYLGVPVISSSGEVIGGLFFGHPAAGVFDERAERLVVGVAAQAAVAIDNARLYEAAQAASDERNQLLESERAARSEAERLSRMKDEFLASLSHELRTPLSAILGWTHVLRRRVKEDADLARGIETIDRNARMQARLIEDLLDMSRITSGKLRLDVQSLDPSIFVEAAIESMRPAALAKGIRIDKVLDPAAGPISGDMNRLQQVVWNLLSNAIKFTPKGGKVRVVLKRVDSHIEVSVADTGVGIGPEFLPHVFDRFRQADASTTRRYSGLGLGLAIVKQLVEMHGGTVVATSGGEGKGATFSLRLPVAILQLGDGARAHPRAETAPKVEFPAADLSGLRVLIVDDEVDARDLVKRVLEDCGAEVFAARDAEEGLAATLRHRPHVLVSDIGMPGVDGVEFLRRVRALGAAGGGNIPAIALTAFARSEDRIKTLNAGFAVHVSKPTEPSELIATVASVVGRSGRT